MRFLISYMFALFSSFIWLSPHAATAASLSLELKKVESGTESCTATFLLVNRLGQSLDRFRLEMILIDSKGEFVERLLINLAPLSHDRTTVASFPLLAGNCSNISRILIKDVPACRAEGGKKVDCLSSLVVKTRVLIKISK